MAKAYALTLLGVGDEASGAVERAVELDEIEASLERADLADSFLDPDAAWPILEALDRRDRKRNARAAVRPFNLPGSSARRGRASRRARQPLASSRCRTTAFFPGSIDRAPRDAAYVAVASGSDAWA